MLNIFLAILFLALISVLFVDTKGKGIITVLAVALIAGLSSYYAARALSGHTYEALFRGNELFGNVLIRIDALSGWFILTIDLTLLTGVVYGLSYMREYAGRKSDITLHCIAYILLHASMIGICSVRNGFVFMILWELLAISVFILVIFDHRKETVKAGFNYLVQSHLSIVFIMLGFLYVGYKTGSYGFESIAEFSKHQSTLAGTTLFLCFFIGFAFKSGFVPFHTWLPYAHPASPSHVSGVMSGVVIKIGIYGILRMLLLIRTDYTTIGYIILILSVITGIYGVMLAIIQHDLKKLLAYHSIENIGIIGIGIGVGCLGLGAANRWMAILGFSGALLHTLNHSLFKSLLFYSTGNVLQAVHTVNVEKLGGLIKKMPQTALLFLVAAIAICGLPPLNGFISEFLIYGGLYNWLYSASLLSLITIVFSLVGLVLIGGLAILCFTKAFGIVFLGTSRATDISRVHETRTWQLVPMYFTALVMILIGLFPSVFLEMLQRPVYLFTHDVVFDLNSIKVGAIDSMQVINRLFVVFILLVLLILGLRKFSGRNKVIGSGPTWGCGYAGAGSKLQYTANSFVRSYSKLAKPLLDIEKKEMEITEVFPADKHYETESYDKMERILLDRPIALLHRFIEYFTFLQNGRLQRYILYGIIFISALVTLPLIIEKLTVLLHFLNNL